MSVLFLLTSPKPRIEGTDAVFQEVSTLREAVNGETLNLYPRKTPGGIFPLQLFGFHALPALRKSERRSRLNHLYFSVPYFFPVLRFLRNPIVYTVVAGAPARSRPSSLAGLASLHHIVVSNERDADALKSWGLTNVAIVSPGIDTSRVTPGTLLLGDEVTLLMASAPWVEEQFSSKGVDALLGAVALSPALKLILLWRGLLLDELFNRIDRLGVRAKVEVVTGHVNVDDYIRRAHASVLLARRGDVVKAYPHSLIESLVAGKPVILTDVLPMADYVRRQDCGVVIDDVSVPAVLAAVEHLKARYSILTANARLIEPDMFSEVGMIRGYKLLYGL